MDSRLYEEQLANLVYARFIAGQSQSTPYSLREAARAVAITQLQSTAERRVVLMCWVTRRFSSQELEPYARPMPAIDSHGKIITDQTFLIDRIIDFLADTHDRLIEVMRQLDPSRVALYLSHEGSRPPEAVEAR